MVCAGLFVCWMIFQKLVEKRSRFFSKKKAMEDDGAVVGSTVVPKSWTFQRDKGKERNVKEKERKQ